MFFAFVALFLCPFLTFGYEKCGSGYKTLSAQVVHIRNTGGDRLFHTCSSFQPEECSVGCVWAPTCRESAGWTHFKGERSYVAGMKLERNKLQLFCCITIANVAEKCQFTEPSTDSHLISLPGLGKTLDLGAKTDIFIRDVLSVMEDGQISVSAEVCTLVQERDDCDMNNQRGAKKRELGALLMRSNRRTMLDSSDEDKSESTEVQQLKEQIFNGQLDKDNGGSAESSVSSEAAVMAPPSKPKPSKTRGSNKKSSEEREKHKPKHASSESEADSFEVDDYYNYSQESEEEEIPSKEKTKKGKAKNDDCPAKECPNPDFKPCVSDKEANRRFQDCCKGLSSGCAAICDYSMSPQSMARAITQGKCSFDAVPQIMECASGGNDASDCCKSKRVFGGAAGPLCKPFCNPSAHDIDWRDTTNLPCAMHTETIAQCFKSTLQPSEDDIDDCRSETEEEKEDQSGEVKKSKGKGRGRNAPRRKSKEKSRKTQDRPKVRSKSVSKEKGGRRRNRKSKEKTGKVQGNSKDKSKGNGRRRGNRKSKEKSRNSKVKSKGKGGRGRNRKSKEKSTKAGKSSKEKKQGIRGKGKSESEENAGRGRGRKNKEKSRKRENSSSKSKSKSGSAEKPSRRREPKNKEKSKKVENNSGSEEKGRNNPKSKEKSQDAENNSKAKSGSNESKGECPKADYSPCLSEEEANEQFKSCCQSKSPGCAAICSYRVTQQAVMTAISSMACPASALTGVMDCASQKRDVRDCCRAKGVFTLGDMCANWCNPTKSSFNFADPSIMLCAPHAFTISSCFMAYLN